MQHSEYVKIGDQVQAANKLTEHIDLVKHYAPEKYQKKIERANLKVSQGLLELSLIYGNIFMQQQKQKS